MVATKATKLSERERAFVDAFMGEAAGNGTRAAIVAGYARKSAAVTASLLIRKHKIQRALAAIAERKTAAAILTAEERDKLLSEFATKKGAALKDRIRSIDLLNKCEGRYSSTLNVREKTLEQLLGESRQ